MSNSVRGNEFEAPEHAIATATSWLCHSHVERQEPNLPWGAADAVAKVSPVTAAEFDRDLSHDICVSNYRWNSNNPWRNKDAGNFVDTGSSEHSSARNTDPGRHGGHSIGAAWADFDNDFSGISRRQEEPKKLSFEGTEITQALDRGKEVVVE